jgi:hypothetical protein
MPDSSAIRAAGAIGLGIALALTVDIALMVATLLPMATARVLAMAGMGTAAPATAMAGMGTVALALGSVSESDAVIKPRVVPANRRIEPKLAPASGGRCDDLVDAKWSRQGETYFSIASRPLSDGGSNGQCKMITGSN